MTPEKITHKVANLKRALYVQYKKDQNAIIVVLHIKTKFKAIYAFVFQFPSANFYYPNIRDSAVRYIANTELKTHLEEFLPNFLAVFNDIEPTNPIHTFYFAKDLGDFNHYKQTAQIQFNTNDRTIKFLEQYFSENNPQNNYLINPPTKSIPMSNPNNHFAPFYMRYQRRTTQEGVDISSFSLSVRFSFDWPNANAETKRLKVDTHQTFVFFANATYPNPDGTQRVESLEPAEIYTYPAKNLPATVSLAIFEAQAAIAQTCEIKAEDVAINFPKDENEAAQFEKLADLELYAKTPTSQAARKLGVDAQAGLNNFIK